MMIENTSVPVDMATSAQMRQHQRALEKSVAQSAMKNLEVSLDLCIDELMDRPVPFSQADVIALCERKYPEVVEAAKPHLIRQEIGILLEDEARKRGWAVTTDTNGDTFIQRR